LINPLPFTVKVKAVVPAMAEGGASEVIDGAGLFGGLMVKLVLPEAPPPGAGLNTVTWAVADAAMSVALMETRSCVPPTYVVVRGDPFQFATEPLINPLPFTVKVNAPLPAVAEAGDKEVIDGDGLAGALIVKLTTPEVPPPGVGVKTVT